jgi:hypothetical protein
MGIPVFRAAGPGQITIPGDAVDEIVEGFQKAGTPVILVGPPIGSTAVGVQWARRAIGTLIVIRQDATRRQDLAVAGESLRYVGASVVGAALVASGRSLPGMKRLSQWRKSPPRSPDETSGWSQVGGSMGAGGSAAPSTGARSSAVAYEDGDPSTDRLTEPSA